MKKSACKFMYRGFYNLGPPALNDMFTLYTTDGELRSNLIHNVDVAKFKTQFSERDFAIRGAIHCNGLPENVKAALSADSFEDYMKKLDLT